MEELAPRVPPRANIRAIAIATGPMLVAYLSLLYSFVTVQDENSTTTVTLPVTVGLLLVPVAFAILAWFSGHDRPAMAVSKSVTAWLIVMTSLGLMTFALGLSLSFGIGGVFSLRAGPDERYRPRFVAQAAAAVYIVILLVIAPPLGAFAAGVLPFMVLGMADYYSRNRAQDKAATEPVGSDGTIGDLT